MNGLQLQNEELRAQEEEMRSQNEELLLKQQEIISINARIERYIQILTALTKSRSLRKGELKNAIIEICKTTSKAMSVERVSLWEYDRKRNSIVCQNQFVAAKDSNSSGIELKEEDFAPYFEAINTEEIIIADNTFEHKATACFSNGYLEENNIKSMLDSPYFVNGNLVGVICCEAVNEYKVWTGEDIVFLKSVADLISLCYETGERKKAEDRIRIKKEEMMSMNDALLQSQAEIQKANESLEKKVDERTKTLELQNSQLQEYTYVNSHLLRGPLCRILGIIYLLENNLIADANIDFLQHLKESASELDDMVKK